MPLPSLRTEVQIYLICFPNCPIGISSSCNAILLIHNNINATSNNEAVTSKNLLPGSIVGTLNDIKVVAKYEAHAKTFLYFIVELVRGHTTS